ncbi:MAG: nucleotidyltransferase [Chitinispirillales bacterium]|jgi:predicted nucleotidyltransferase|nr:nucleotidyltransferase [Chitinispirillales bacterium]
MNALEEMILEVDYKDMIVAFIDEDVRFLLIGGRAVGAYGYPRATKDLDLWVWANPENSVRVIKALEKFGAPMDHISAKDFAKEGTIFQIGVAPVRIDIITATVGVTFEEAHSNLVIMEIDGLKIPVISLTDLIKNKKAAGRQRDLNDVQHLEKILEIKSRNIKRR